MFEWIGANLNTLLVAGLGGVLVFCADRVIYFIIGKFFPVIWFKDIAKTINDNLEAMKRKYPVAGKELEDKVLAGLRDAITEIEK